MEELHDVGHSNDGLFWQHGCYVAGNSDGGLLWQQTFHGGIPMVVAF